MCTLRIARELRTQIWKADETFEQYNERVRDILQRIPAGRWGQPEDMGGAAVFLASSAANYVHGHTLAVDGGWS